MTEEFITARGKVHLNDQRLIVQDLKVEFSKTLVGELSLPVIVFTLTILSFWNRSKAFGFIAAVYAVLFILYYFDGLYTILLKKSYSNYIAVNRINSVTVKPDKFGLETEVRVHLKNGRFRSIVFRARENQYEPFIKSISQYILQPQLA
jgi:hypothetical protein